MNKELNYHQSYLNLNCVTLHCSRYCCNVTIIIIIVIIVIVVVIISIIIM